MIIYCLLELNIFYRVLDYSHDEHDLFWSILRLCFSGFTDPGDGAFNNGLHVLCRSTTQRNNFLGSRSEVTMLNLYYII